MTEEPEREVNPADEVTADIIANVREVIYLLDKYAIECAVHDVAVSRALVASRNGWAKILADYDRTS